MKNECEQKPMGFQEVMRCQLIELLVYTMRKIQLPNPEAFDNGMIQHVLKYVQQHYPEKLSLKTITQKYDYSLSRISRIFKSEIGYSFQEYVQSVRIQESCRLLINTTKKVTDIATSVGYSDIKHFNEIFKRQTGMSPRQYRNANKN
jgi:AraC family L-rhamnose operon transcriptional activator RhaR